MILLLRTRGRTSRKAPRKPILSGGEFRDVNAETTDHEPGDLVRREQGSAGPVTHTLAQRNGSSDAEIVFSAGTALLAGAVILALRGVDVVVAWPELFGRRRSS
jgi:hypothetical protein